MVDAAQTRVAEAEARRYAALTAAVGKLGREASRIYRLLTNESGDLAVGVAESQLLAFRLGVSLSVRPPSESSVWVSYDQLSGGQQSLASLALVLGFHAAFPSPLLLMDEVEGALDATYAQRVASALRSGIAFGMRTSNHPNPREEHPTGSKKGLFSDQAVKQEILDQQDAIPQALTDIDDSWREQWRVADEMRQHAANATELSQAQQIIPRPQLIVVTLRRSMYSHAPLVVGCFQFRGTTHALSVAFSQIEGAKNTTDDSEERKVSRSE